MGRFRAYLGLGLLATAAYPVMPMGMFKDAIFYLLVGLSAVVAILVGTRAHSAEHPWAWYMLAAGQFLFVIGDAIWSIYEYGFNQNPFPSAADALYLAGYPVLAAGLLLLIRQRSRAHDWTSLIDASIITVGLGTLFWTFLIAPTANDSTMSVTERAISSAYPIADVFVLGVAVWLFVGPGVRNVAYWFIAASLVVLLVTDVAYWGASLAGTYQSGSPIDTGWLASYVLFGAGVLHPSARDIAQRDEDRPQTLTRRRLALLTVAALLPTILLTSDNMGGPHLNATVATGASAVLFLLALMRLSAFIAAHEQSLRRESTLRRAAARLAGAPDRLTIYQVSVDAALELGNAEPGSRAALAVASGDGLCKIVAASGQTTHALDRCRLDDLPREVAEALKAGTSAALPAARTGSVVLLPVIVREELAGTLAVSGRRLTGPQVRHALETLTTQTGLALEGAAAIEEQQQRKSELRFAALVSHASDVIVVLDADLLIRYPSPSVETVFQRRPDTLIGTAIGSIVHESDVDRAAAFLGRAHSYPGLHAPVELRIRRQDGEIRNIEIVANNLLDEPSVAGIVLTMHDVTERRALERQLTHQAFHDVLTGLPNRALFANRVEHSLSRPDKSSVTVVFLDLDDFKTVNDSLGHAAGDELLVSVAQVLTASLRAGDTCARLGGDEFAMLLENTGAREGLRVAARTLDELHRPLRLQGREVFVQASAGVATGCGGAAEAEELLRDADTAMYRAKVAGKGSLEFFMPDMRDAALSRLEMKAELQRAVEQEELLLHYQPIIALATGTVAGFEALVRWDRPGNGLVPPEDFIPLAEETGLIMPLGRWVLAEACRQAVAWKVEGADPGPFLSVNLSPRQLLEPDLVGDVEHALASSGLEPGALVLEITENVLLTDSAAAARSLVDLHALGIRIAIDDFGVRYSSLGRLDRFPVNMLKIDGAFVQGTNHRLVAAVVDLGRSLGIETVAEGIETPAELAQLLQLGCPLGQGFLFSKPVEAEQAAEIARRGSIAVVGAAA